MSKPLLCILCIIFSALVTCRADASVTGAWQTWIVPQAVGESYPLEGGVYRRVMFETDGETYTATTSVYGFDALVNDTFVKDSDTRAALEPVFNSVVFYLTLKSRSVDTLYPTRADAGLGQGGDTVYLFRRPVSQADFDEESGVTGYARELAYLYRETSDTLVRCESGIATDDWYVREREDVPDYADVEQGLHIAALDSGKYDFHTFLRGETMRIMEIAESGKFRGTPDLLRVAVIPYEGWEHDTRGYSMFDSNQLSAEERRIIAGRIIAETAIN